MMKPIKKIFLNTYPSKLIFIIKQILFYSHAFPKLSIAPSKSPDLTVKAASCVRSTLVVTDRGKTQGEMGKCRQVVFFLQMS